MKSLVESIFSKKEDIADGLNIWKGYDDLISHIEKIHTHKGTSYIIQWGSENNKALVKSIYNIITPVIIEFEYIPSEKRLYMKMYDEKWHGAVKNAIKITDDVTSGRSYIKSLTHIIDIFKKLPDAFDKLPLNNALSGVIIDLKHKKYD